MSQFLREHLDNVDLHDEFGLKGMFRYELPIQNVGKTHSLGRRLPVMGSEPGLQPIMLERNVVLLIAGVSQRMQVCRIPRDSTS